MVTLTAFVVGEKASVTAAAHTACFTEKEQREWSTSGFEINSFTKV